MQLQGLSLMDGVTCSCARAKLASTMDRVRKDHEALIFRRNRRQLVVMLSLEDDKALEEAAHLPCAVPAMPGAGCRPSGN